MVIQKPHFIIGFKLCSVYFTQSIWPLVFGCANGKIACVHYSILISFIILFWYSLLLKIQIRKFCYWKAKIKLKKWTRERKKIEKRNNIHANMPVVEKKTMLYTKMERRKFIFGVYFWCWSFCGYLKWPTVEQMRCI